MNKIISNTRKALTLFALAAVMTSFSLTSRAMTRTANEPGNDSKTAANTSDGNTPVYPHYHDHAGSASTADVKYLGGQEDGSLFNVLYNNTTGAKFTLTVLDGEGDRIFQAIYAGRNFDKKFKVLDAGSYGKLTFIIRSAADNSVQRFEVNSSTQVIEDIEVKQLK
jgi:hypothetical protein